MSVVKLHDKDSRVVGNITGQITISIYNGEFKGHPNFLIQADHSVCEIADVIEDLSYSYYITNNLNNSGQVTKCIFISTKFDMFHCYNIFGLIFSSNVFIKIYFVTWLVLFVFNYN